MAQVLQTRCVGFATDSSRHPLAPVEVVYEVEAPVRRSSWLQRIVVMGSLIVVIGIATNAVLDVLKF